MMNTNVFVRWREDPVTKALFKFLEDAIQLEKQSIPSWEDVENPNRLAYKMGLMAGLDKIKNIDKEDLIEYESEGKETVRE